MWKKIVRRSRVYGAISVAVFFLLYLFTAICVLMVLIVAPLNRSKPVRRIMRFWARSIFLMLGK